MYSTLARFKIISPTSGCCEVTDYEPTAIDMDSLTEAAPREGHVTQGVEPGWAGQGWSGRAWRVRLESESAGAGAGVGAGPWIRVGLARG